MAHRVSNIGRINRARAEGVGSPYSLIRRADCETNLEPFIARFMQQAEALYADWLLVA